MAEMSASPDIVCCRCLAIYEGDEGYKMITKYDISLAVRWHGEFYFIYSSREDEIYLPVKCSAILRERECHILLLLMSLYGLLMPPPALRPMTSPGFEECLPHGTVCDIVAFVECQRWNTLYLR